MTDPRKLGMAFRAGLAFSLGRRFTVQNRLAQDEAKWITVHPNGKGMTKDGDKAKGQPVLIDGETGEVLGGMGGKFTGKHISAVPKRGKEEQHGAQVKIDRSHAINHVQKLIKDRTDRIDQAGSTKEKLKATQREIEKLKELSERLGNSWRYGESEKESGQKRIDQVIEHLQKNYLDVFQKQLDEEHQQRVEAYKQRIQNKRDYYQSKADQYEKSAAEKYEHAHKVAERMPLGQPIVNEAVARGYRQINKAYNSAFREMDKRDYYQEKADNYGTSNAISGDDPEAIQKLEAKVEKLKRQQEFMKKANAVIRKGKTNEERMNGLIGIGCSEKTAKELLKPDFMGRIGYPAYSLSNNLANIKSAEKRITALKNAQNRGSISETHENYSYKEDPDDNRIHFVFNGKPSEEVRSILKHNGFKWSPRRGAWVRQLTLNARYSAKRVKEQLGKING